MDNAFGCILMAAVTFPVSFLVARACLRGVIRIVFRGQATQPPNSVALRS
jgi:hypothetical protein